MHDACGPLSLVMPADISAMQRRALTDATTSWNTLGFTQLQFDDAADRITVRFRPAAPMLYGLYEPDTGELILNALIEVRSALTVVAAHELGHAMGLVHIEPSERASVMNQGNITLPPTPADNTVLTEYWRGCR